MNQCLSMELPIDIFNYIMSLLTSYEQLRLIQVCKLFNTSLKITNLYNLSYDHIIRLTDEILNKYPCIEYLNLYDNKKVSNLDNFKYLSKLCIVGQCWINDNDLKLLTNLTTLDARNNYTIKNISHLTKLIDLDIGGVCNVDDDDIKNLNLIKLSCSMNNKITQVKHFSRLTHLKIHVYCGISLDELCKCQSLQFLDLRYNSFYNYNRLRKNITIID